MDRIEFLMPGKPKHLPPSRVRLPCCWAIMSLLSLLVAAFQQTVSQGLMAPHLSFGVCQPQVLHLQCWH